jgi:hypothetical protein
MVWLLHPFTDIVFWFGRLARSRYLRYDFTKNSFLLSRRLADLQFFSELVAINFGFFRKLNILGFENVPFVSLGGGWGIHRVRQFFVKTFHIQFLLECLVFLTNGLIHGWSGRQTNLVDIQKLQKVS